MTYQIMLLVLYVKPCQNNIFPFVHLRYLTADYVPILPTHGSWVNKKKQHLFHSCQATDLAFINYFSNITLLKLYDLSVGLNKYLKKIDVVFLFTMQIRYQSIIDSFLIQQNVTHISYPQAKHRGSVRFEMSYSRVGQICFQMTYG
jgi:hypothetical protein